MLSLRGAANPGVTVDSETPRGLKRAAQVVVEPMTTQHLSRPSRHPTVRTAS